MAKRTTTSSFGTTKREGHDASRFYARSLYLGPEEGATTPADQAQAADADTDTAGVSTTVAARQEPLPREAWGNRIYCGSSESMSAVPNDSVGLAFTSPPYNVGKDYDHDMTLDAYLALIGRVAAEVHRVLVPGGRYVVNIANLGRKPYIPLHAHFYRIHAQAGFLPMGEIIWQKAKGASSSCAWGSWQSPKAPRLRDVHEYLLVFAKEGYSRPDRGETDLSREDFLTSTISVWDIPAESARSVGHPAPFPVALAARVIKLYSYRTDVVLDPFAGSGTTCVAAASLGREWVGYEINPDYCELARTRLAAVGTGV